MKKEMFITVGTSLYFSASWENEGPAAAIEGYAEWLKGDKKTRPEERRKSRKGMIEEELRASLTAQPENVEKWTAILPEKLLSGEHDPTENLRFSAELSSLFMLADSEKVNVRDLLSSYEAVHVVVDPTDWTHGSSYVVGMHLKGYLQVIAGSDDSQKIALFEVPELASKDPGRLLAPDGGLRCFLRKVKERVESSHAGQLDFLASGGYKVYMVMLSQLIANRQDARLLYLHEEAAELLEVTGGHIRIGTSQYNFQPDL